MLNQGTLSCYKNLPKKLQSFLCVIVTSLSPKSVTSGVYNVFPQTTQKILITIRHLPLTGTDHCNSRPSENIQFCKTITNFTTMFFSQGSNFQVQFWMDCVFPLMPIISSYKNSSCVQTTTQVGWHSTKLFQTSEQSDEYWLPVKLKQYRSQYCIFLNFFCIIKTKMWT